jgi:hypothetical protein
MTQKEARTTSPPVVPVEATPMLRYLPMYDCNLLSDPRVLLKDFNL